MNYVRHVRKITRRNCNDEKWNLLWAAWGGLKLLRQQAGICTPFNTLFKFIMTQVARDAGGCRTRESAFSAVELSSLIFRGLCESLCALQRGKCNKLSKILESPWAPVPDPWTDEQGGVEGWCSSVVLWATSRQPLSKVYFCPFQFPLFVWLSAWLNVKLDFYYLFAKYPRYCPLPSPFCKFSNCVANGEVAGLGVRRTAVLVRIFWQNPYNAIS